jgi:hypothetical protein
MSFPLYCIWGSDEGKSLILERNPSLPSLVMIWKMDSLRMWKLKENNSFCSDLIFVISRQPRAVRLSKFVQILSNSRLYLLILVL